LAAFIVVAIIAAILLVTSVRSQAAPGWLRVPATTVAGPPTSSDLASHQTSQVRRTVRPGLLLVHRTTTTAQPTAAVVASVVRQAPVTQPVTQPVAQPVAPSRHRVVPTSPPASRPGTTGPVRDPGVPGHQGHGHHTHSHQSHGHHLGRRAPDHGRHLGWTRSPVAHG